METQAVTSQSIAPQRLKAIVLNGGGHAFDTMTGRSYNVNRTAQVALLLLQDGATREQVLDALIGLCSQPEAVVAAGIDAFLEKMTRYTA